MVPNDYSLPLQCFILVAIDGVPLKLLADALIGHSANLDIIVGVGHSASPRVSAVASAGQPAPAGSRVLVDRSDAIAPSTISADDMRLRTANK
jgi:hypothetical protein